MNISNSSKAGILKSILLITGIFLYSQGYSQLKLPTSALQVSAGYSRHGSGDFEGIIFGTEYIKYYSKKLSLNYNIRATINDGQETIRVHNTTSDTHTDASIRFTTAGVQLGVDGGLSIVRSKSIELMLSLGAFGRFQSASNGTDGYQLYYPNATGQPTVLVGYDNHTPIRTLAVGGIIHFNINYTFKNKYFIGLGPAFQTDTNGDAIPQGSLMIGRRF